MPLYLVPLNDAPYRLALNPEVLIPLLGVTIKRTFVPTLHQNRTRNDIFSRGNLSVLQDCSSVRGRDDGVGTAYDGAASGEVRLL